MKKENSKDVPTVQQNYGVIRLQHAGSLVLMVKRNRPRPFKQSEAGSTVLITEYQYIDLI